MDNRGITEIVKQLTNQQLPLFSSQEQERIVLAFAKLPGQSGWRIVNENQTMASIRTLGSHLSMMYLLASGGDARYKELDLSVLYSYAHSCGYMERIKTSELLNEMKTKKFSDFDPIKKENIAFILMEMGLTEESKKFLDAQNKNDISDILEKIHSMPEMIYSPLKNKYKESKSGLDQLSNNQIEAERNVQSIESYLPLAIKSNARNESDNDDDKFYKFVNDLIASLPSQKWKNSFDMNFKAKPDNKMNPKEKAAESLRMKMLEISNKVDKGEINFDRAKDELKSYLNKFIAASEKMQHHSFFGQSIKFKESKVATALQKFMAKNYPTESPKHGIKNK